VDWIDLAQESYWWSSPLVKSVTKFRVTQNAGNSGSDDEY